MSTLPSHPRDEWVLSIIEELASQDAAAAAARAAGNGSIWDAAVRLELVDSSELLDAIATRLRTPVATSLESTDQARAILPERMARRYQVLPLAVSDTTIDVATSNPWDLDSERSIAFVCGRSVRMWLAEPG